MSKHPRRPTELSFSKAGLVILLSTTAASSQDSANHQGIWKSVVPPKDMRGEFDNHDPVGLASGARIKVDCSINWPDPDTGQLYCFNSATSLVYFLDWPTRNIEKARKAWLSMQQTD